MSDDPAGDARLARQHLERLLAAPDARPVAAALPAGYGDAIERYVALLLEANRAINLTRISEPEPVARLHLLDALASLPWIGSEVERAIDLGSGGGVPAVPLALARPEMRWTLVESVGRKARVLQSLVAELGLRSVEVVAERAETVGRDVRYRERHQLVTARACAALPVVAEYALPLLTVGGRLLAWKGPLTHDDAELVRGRAAALELGGARPQLHDTGLRALGGHRFVVIHKRAPTPARFPRRPGEPARRPLG